MLYLAPDYLKTYLQQNTGSDPDQSSTLNMCNSHRDSILVNGYEDSNIARSSLHFKYILFKKYLKSSFVILYDNNTSVRSEQFIEIQDRFNG